MDYLQKIKATNSNKCKDCGDVVIDTTEHLITKCERCDGRTNKIKSSVQQFDTNQNRR